MAPKIRGNSLYYVSNAANITTAREETKAIGGKLAKIEDASEMAFITQSYSYAYGGDYWCLFTGGAVTSSQRLWDDGTPMLYQNWQPGEPNFGDGGTSQPKIILKNTFASWESGWSTGKWDDAPLSDIADPTYKDPKGRSGYLSEITLSLNVTRSAAPKEGAGLFTTSINLSAGTQASGNLANGTTVYWKVSGITADDLGSGSAGLTGSGTITNGKLDIQHALKKDTDTGDTFEVSVFSDAEMTQQIGQSSQSIVLESQSRFAIRNGMLYALLNRSTWKDARTQAVKVGGNLVTVNDAEMNGWLVAQFKGAEIPEGAWIGLSDEVNEGYFKWSSGAEFTYRNWHTLDGRVYQPDDAFGGQDYVRMLFPSESAYWDPRSTGMWDDCQSSTILNGIAEIPFIQRGDSAYVIVEGPTWEEAEANAQALGGHLVTINDQAENDWIHKNIDLSNQAWMGLRFDTNSGKWTWESGDSSEFRNWNEGEPNGNNTQWQEYYGVIRKGWSGRWNDASNAHAAEVIYGIAEIKLAPNNAPTGTPSVTGTLKAGSTITINASSIQDADNFTGYTPAYQYAWEVSTDGNTWSKLTSTDATDNNTTYTLTSAEVGKQVRGVVSYLDGYGTTEVVNSSASTTVANNLTVRGNSLYTIVDGPSWTQAEANSVKLGGHLVTVNERGEEDLLYKSFGQDLPIYQSTSLPAKGLWIGLNDTQAEGVYKWVSGDSSTWFESTYKGKRGWIPNADSSAQDYMIMRRNALDPAGYDWDDYWHTTGSWSGVAVDNGIAETPFIRRGDSAYVIVQGPTWEEAEANAVKLGGHLVTINDATENEWIINTYGKDFLTTPWWIGYSDKDLNGIWEWIDGSNSVFTRWAPREPNTNGDYGANYAQMYVNTNISSTLGLWNDAPNWNGWNPDGYPTQGIAEIKLAPNNLPTGTPSITGTLKAGSTLTIDASTIQDADNFTGYTPTYQYAWEVSTDGTTWSKLTSTDATDNNTTYTLTSAEVGKQVRGVVSYLDGYGTNEVVSSTSTNKIQALTSTPGVTISGSDKTTGEDGDSAVFSVTLNTAPIYNVTINFTISDATEGKLTASSLTFTSTNWNTPQTLTVTGVDDYDNDGNIAYNLSASITTRDLSYIRLVIPTIALTNLDDGLDTPIYWYGTDEIDYKSGGNADDRLYGRGNMDELKGGLGNDRLYGQEDDDFLYGEDGNDLLYGGYDDDFLSGGNGNDELYGEGGNDRLEGGSGNDLIDGGSGADTMIGGAGNDTYYVDNANDVIDDQGLSTDVDTVIVLNATSYTLSANVENGTLQQSATATDLTGNALNNSLTGNDLNNNIIGGGGNDKLYGGGGNDELYAGDGNDTVDAGTGDDLIIGGNGAGDDRYDGGTGVDTVKYTSAQAAITVNLLSGSATSTAGRDAAKIGTDVLSNIENIIAGNFNDTLIGNSLNNAINGQDGNDLITGGLGADRLTGGAGSDTFVFVLADTRLNAFDVITDFAIGTDKIDGPTSVASLSLKKLGAVASLTQGGISAVLTAGNFVKNGAATFTYGAGSAARTFLALNDTTAGFDSSKDGLIEITGYSGLLANLAII